MYIVHIYIESISIQFLARNDWTPPLKKIVNAPLRKLLLAQP